MIIDKKTFSYLSSIFLKDINRYFYKDKDGEICFKLYCFLDPSQGKDALSVAKIVLKDVKNGLTANIKFNLNDDSVFGKLRYFVEYHNRTVLTYGKEFEVFLIDMDIFNK